MKEKCIKSVKSCKRKRIGISILTAISLLTFFFILQCQDSKVLSLDIRWILVSLLPILIALILDGYITKIKSGDFEIEIRNIDNWNNSNLLEFNEAYIIEKGEIKELTNTKRQADILSFQINEKRKYNQDAIKIYLSKLTKVKYILILDKDNKFKHLLPFESQIKDKYANELYNGLSNNDFENQLTTDLRNKLIDSFVECNDNLKEVYQKFKCLNLKDKDILPVLDGQHKLIGTISLHTVEQKIISEAISNYKC